MSSFKVGEPGASEQIRCSACYWEQRQGHRFLRRLRFGCCRICFRITTWSTYLSALRRFRTCLRTARRCLAPCSRRNKQLENYRNILKLDETRCESQLRHMKTWSSSTLILFRSSSPMRTCKRLHWPLSVMRCWMLWRPAEHTFFCANDVTLHLHETTHGSQFKLFLLVWTLPTCQTTLVENLCVEQVSSGGRSRP